MIVSKFEPKESPELKAVIHELILNRQIKAISSRTTKPDINLNQPPATQIQEFEYMKPAISRPEVIRAITHKQKLKNMKSELKAQ